MVDVLMSDYDVYVGFALVFLAGLLLLIGLTVELLSEESED